MQKPIELRIIDSALKFRDCSVNVQKTMSTLQTDIQNSIKSNKPISQKMLDNLKNDEKAKAKYDSLSKATKELFDLLNEYDAMSGKVHGSS